jgi:peptidoglycan/xylan/chitin deacetylase (PgdA/CDA1 family)
MPERIAALSFDDGGWTDEIMIGVIETYKVPATFYLISGCLLESAYMGMNFSMIRDMYLSSKCVEIGCHSRTHQRLNSIPPDLHRQETIQAREEVRKFFDGKAPVDCYAYPYGVPGLVPELKQAGFSWARSCQRDNPAEVGRAKNPFAMPVTQMLTPSYVDSIDAPRALGLPIHMVGHGYELQRPHWKPGLIHVIETLLADGYVFLTNSDFFPRTLCQPKK